ncbi:CPBP family intramembrane metalloprotease [Clostridium swellfunianum]|uniref:CPBP family intramembrane glutamic endopeptidase n=1 Tax=Clostridium swellfunianum TaxID=1367462 RepID=UPI00202F1BF7|nr:CPBP family intramembrane glutamic endopeptidase [Clostridium swellfunianum]MCM0648269.1 CPBP family intramembrane metalloprotease [Clostridium swellfunianum]
MSKRVTINYLIWTFVLTYMTWGGIIVANQFGYLKYGTPLCMVLYVIGGNAPPIIAYIVLKQAGKIKLLKQFIGEVFAIKQKPKYYALLVDFLALYFGIPALMHGVQKGAELYIGVLFIPVMILFGGLEELGWRYILQPSLEKRFSFGVSTSITACIWAVWHLPLFFIQGTIQSKLSFGIFTVMVFGMSFALASIYRLSKSIWLCILFHSAINSLSSSWIIADDLTIKICTSIVIIIFSSMFILFKRKAYIQNEQYYQ